MMKRIALILLLAVASGVSAQSGVQYRALKSRKRT